ncbi:histidine kinase [Vallitalea pronyensis]|uniref:Histidine kinase n=1 Tax=Vallitalea pronyensis TaxID=1348613 RepID=A0A8J8MHY8_9FIRM|nr:histidine kinase [Vallitalea pronyensis]QUI21990.1 histidine kinase [Vallitalea pronyensis]
MFKKIKFQTKVFLSNVIMIFIIMIFFTTYFYSFVVQVELDKAQKNLNVYASKVSDQLNDMVYSMDRTALQLASNPSIIQLFNDMPKNPSSNYFAREPHITKRLTSLVTSYNSKKNFLGRICLYNDYNDFFYSGHLAANQDHIDAFFSGDGFLAIQEQFRNGSYSLFIPPREDPFSVKGYNYDDSPLFSIVRQIINFTLFGTPTYGYVEVQQPITRITEMFGFLPASINGYVLDDTGSIIYPGNSEQDEMSDALRDMLEKAYAKSQANTPASSYPSSQYLGAYSNVTEMEGLVVLIQPSNEVIASLVKFRTLILLTAVLIIVFVTATQFLIIRKLTTPLRDLRQSINEVNLNNLSIHIEHDEGYNELNKLNIAFNKMCEKLKESIDERVKAHTSELKSHLYALQSQMDPHFYHNILTVISIIAEEHDVMEITKICNKLSSMLRFSTSYNISHSTIHEEIHHTINYLELMKVRYENLFTFDVTMDEQYKDIVVPKLIIQPLTENCFAHGFKNKRPPWHIGIHMFTAEDKWVIEVVDNGTGFDKDSLASLNTFISEFNIDQTSVLLEDLNIGGLCLSNIYVRLKILYGDDMLFNITSEKEQTKMTIGGKLHV